MLHKSRAGTGGHACYFTVGTWLSNFCHGATL